MRRKKRLSGECPELETVNMESTEHGPEIEAFMGACETLAEFALHNGFTENEREIIMINFRRTLERHIVPSSLPSLET